MPLLLHEGDATLSAYDLRISHKRYNDLDSLANKSSRSDDQEAELSCLSVCKGGRKVLCGTQDGVILIFSWGRWGDCSDRFPGHPETVDCMLTIDDSTVLTGSSDGLIRVLSVLPNKVDRHLCCLEAILILGFTAVRCWGRWEITRTSP